jgi:hypothetical protein
MGQEYHEKVFPVHIASILNDGLVDAGSSLDHVVNVRQFWQKQNAWERERERERGRERERREHMNQS